LSVPAQYQLTGATVGEIAAGVERAVAAGTLAAGAPLPAVRTLARQLGVSPTTVAAALAELRRRGVIVSRPRSGTRIAERPPLRSARPAPAVPAGVRDLAAGNPDPALLPDLAAALRDLPAPHRLYGEAPVAAELAAVAARALAADGIPASQLAGAAGRPPGEAARVAAPGEAARDAAPGGPPRDGAPGEAARIAAPGKPPRIAAPGEAARIAVVSGALDGIERVLAAHLAPGDAVAVEDPGWPGVLDLVRALGLRPAPVPLDERGMRPDALAAVLKTGARAAVLTPRGQNPTGAAFDAARAAELRELLRDVLVVEDDHLGPVAGVPWCSAAGAGGRWAIVRSASKWLGPDLRCAVLAGDELTLARVEGRMSLGPGWVSSLLQRLTARLWADPAVLALVDRAAATYTLRREAMLAALAAHGLAAGAPSGLNVWVPVPDEDAAVRALLAAGASVAAGAPFRLHTGPAVRITTAALEPHDAPALAAALAAAAHPPRRTRAA
jgi:DNA-binding transcriptional MocR family regulator